MSFRIREEGGDERTGMGSVQDDREQSFEDTTGGGIQGRDIVITFNTE